MGGGLFRDGIPAGNILFCFRHIEIKEHPGHDGDLIRAFERYLTGGPGVQILPVQIRYRSLVPMPTISRFCGHCMKYTVSEVSVDNTPLTCLHCQKEWGRVEKVEMVFGGCSLWRAPRRPSSY